MSGTATALLTATACALAVLAAGCGEEDDAAPGAAPTPGVQQPTVSGDIGEATEALEAFLVALADGDAAAACGLLSRRGRALVEEGALLGSPEGGGDCEDVVVESYNSPDETVHQDIQVYFSERSTDGALRLRYANADTPITGAVTAVLRQEAGEWKLDSTALPRWR